MKKVIIPALALALLATAATYSKAQTITWGTAHNITDSSNLVDSTTVLGATEFDAMTGAYGTGLVDGVTFNAPVSNLAMTGEGDASGDISYLLNSPETNNTFAYTAANSDVTGAAYLALLGQGVQWFGNGTVTLSNLTPGATYDVQVFSYGAYAQYGSGLLTLGGTTPVTINSDVEGVNYGTGDPFHGQFSTGVFVAPLSGTETFTFGGSGVNVLGPINVEQVPVMVPEPSTWAFIVLGLGVLGVQLRRRVTV